MAKLLKVAGKSNRKPLKHARKAEILEDKFENTQGPIDTQHLLISSQRAIAISWTLKYNTCEDFFVNAGPKGPILGAGRILLACFKCSKKT